MQVKGAGCAPPHSDASSQCMLTGTQVKGKLLELARHHTASRILQFCVMYGTDAQKRLLMDQVGAPAAGSGEFDPNMRTHCVPVNWSSRSHALKLGEGFTDRQRCVICCNVLQVLLGSSTS
eukprot:1161769-Pelagomonas_calceolata.AAC.6